MRTTATTSDRDLPDHHSTMATRSTSTDQDYLALVWFCFRLLQLFSSCMAFWLVTSGFRKRGYGDVNIWAMLIWFLSLPISLIVVIVELCYIQSHFHFSYHMPSQMPASPPTSVSHRSSSSLSRDTSFCLMTLS